MNKISINIWDDFWEDDSVPEREIQTTFMYIEKGIPESENQNCLSLILDYMRSPIIEKSNLLSDVTVYLTLYNSRDKYPKLAHENPSSMYSRWELRFINLSHEKLELLLKNLQKSNLKYLGMPIDFFSES